MIGWTVAIQKWIAPLREVNMGVKTLLSTKLESSPPRITWYQVVVNTDARCSLRLQLAFDKLIALKEFRCLSKAGVS